MADTMQRIVARRLRSLGREQAKVAGLGAQRAHAAQVTAVMEQHGAALRLFRTGERNALVRSGFQDLGDFWLAEYLPLRFTNRGYVLQVLGYRGKKRFNPRSRPLVASGALAASVTERGYAVARATQHTASVTIRLPVPSAGGFRYATGNPIVNDVMRQLPPSEMRALIQRLGRFLASAVNDSVLLAKPARGRRPVTQVRRLNLRQRVQFAAKPRRAALAVAS